MVFPFYVRPEDLPKLEVAPAIPPLGELNPNRTDYLTGRAMAGFLVLLYPVVSQATVQENFALSCARIYDTFFFLAL